MAVNVATLTARLEADIRDFDRDMKTANRRVRDLEDSTKKAGGAFKGMGKLMGAIAFAAIGRKVFQLGKEMTMLAVDAEEAGSAFKTTFGPAVDKAQKFVDEFANKAGFAEHELQQLMATTGNIIQGLGATEDASFGLSEQMATLAADVASFSNAAGGAPAVLRALQSALTGEREALKTYGIVVSETDVVERALLTTHKESAGELTKLDKAMATLAIASERAGKAVGDLDRTQDSAANTMRRINAQLTEMKTTVGKELLPALELMLPVLEEIILSLGPKLVNAVQTSLKYLLAIGGIFDEDMRHAANLVAVVQNLNKEWLKGESGIRKFYVGMRELDRVQSLTKRNFDALASSLDLTKTETREAAREMRDYLIAQDIPVEEITRWITDLGLAIDKEAFARRLATAEAAKHNQALGDTAGAARGAIDPVKGLGNAMDYVRDQADKAAGALGRYVTALVTATNPVFRAVQAWEDYQEGIKDGDDSLEDLQNRIAAVDAFVALGEPEKGIKAISEASGWALEDVEKLFETLGLWDGKTFAFDVIARTAFGEAPPTTYRPQSPGWNEPETSYRPNITPPPAFGAAGRLPPGVSEHQFGGTVPGPIGQPRLAVVHGGEEITPVGGGGSVVINQYVTDDFRDPAAARRIIRELARELDDYRKETVR